MVLQVKFQNEYFGYARQAPGAPELVNPEADGNGWTGDELDVGVVVACILQLDQMTGI